MIISKQTYMKELLNFIETQYGSTDILKKYEKQRDDLIIQHMLSYIRKYCEVGNVTEVKKADEYNRIWFNAFLDEIRK